MPEPQKAVVVRNVSKDFRLAAEQRQTFKERVVNPRFDRNAKVFHALQDVSFEVNRGEFFGIVGRNGSGKSTLLKCIAGIYRTDSGSIQLAGRLSTFIELGVGFNPDLAARDNIILNGIMLGLSPKDAASRVDEVIAFAELEDHVDLKLKNYSSGMQVRLAFSVMTQVDADVLLIDEVLAVGDAAFQAKCFEVFRQLREAGKTIILVTHDMGAVQRFCDRAMLVEDGVVVAEGEPDEIGDRYLSLNFERPALSSSTSAPATIDELADADASRARVIGGYFLDVHGERISHARTGDTVVLALDVEAIEDIEDPHLTAYLRDEEDNDVFGASSRSAPDKIERLAAGTHWRQTVHVPLLLKPGRLRLRAVLTGSGDRQPLHRTHDMDFIEVTSLEQVGGIAALPHDVGWSQLDSAALTGASRPGAEAS